MRRSQICFRGVFVFSAICTYFSHFAAGLNVYIVDRSSETTCVVEGGEDEAAAWELKSFTNDAKQFYEESDKFEIWTKSGKKDRNNMDLKGWNQTNEIVENNLGAVTDLRWHDFPIIIANGTLAKKTSIYKDKRNAYLHYSILSNIPVKFEIDTDLEFNYVFVIDQQNQSSNSFETTLITTQNELLEKYTNKEPLFKHGRRWITCTIAIKEFSATMATLSLKIGEQRIIKHNLKTNSIKNVQVKSNQEESSYVYFFKQHQYNMWVAPTISEKLTGTFQLDGKEKACLSVTYFSEKQNMSLKIRNDSKELASFSLQATEAWRVEKLGLMDVFGAGTYTVEVQSSKTGFQAIGAIRVCSSKEYFVYPKLQSLNLKECYTLATDRKSTLTIKTLTLEEIQKINSTEIFELKQIKKICPNEINCNGKICDSRLGCFCFQGYNGSTCSKACESSYYGFSCLSKCDKCQFGLCEKITGNCSKGCIPYYKDPPRCATKIDEPPDLIGIYIGGGVGLVIVVVTVLIIVLVCRYKKIKKNALEAESLQFAEMGPYGVNLIKKAEFAEHFKTNSENGTLESEYQSLPRGQQNQWEVGVSSPNLKKNRYNKIAAYDYNRVVLSGNEDYINASYIHDFANRNAYIAAQGPKSDTTIDFWRMIWQEGVSSVIMLCELFEGEKMGCQKYWPDLNCREVYGNFNVFNKTEKKYESFVERTLRVTSPQGVRQVIQLHYTAWPRQGVPSELGPLTNLMEIIQAKKQIPILVHCSGGTGRTGAIILADQCLRNMAHFGGVSVFEICKKIRRERVNMVETLEQYIFVHHLIIHYLQI